MNGHRTTLRGLKPGNVPTSRVGPIIAQLIEERWPQGELDVLAEKVGCDESAIRYIIAQHHPGTEFDLADRILCALGRSDMWIGALADVYPTKFLETCASPACHKRFPEKQVRDATTKRFCSKKCQRLEEAIRRGLASGQRARNRCNRGHRFTPENTIIRKSGKRQCRTCVNERRRERMQDPQHRARVQAYNAAYQAQKRAALAA